MTLVMSQTREGIIEDLWSLGVKVDAVLKSNPPVYRLREMRDKLMSLSEAVKAVPLPRL